ncbi:MAG TPA: baseplate J/gp47 family protein, partial [Candidatus Saccharibacteria bacterium]|nr:baseplate J/gp47 family protein [Candidatus Saccharibacteria bacterium]
IPAGTKLTTSSGYVFATDEAVVLTTGNFTGVNVGMTAVVAGDDYNNRSGSMSGAPSGVSATIVGSTSGGTTDMARVVSGDDIERARGQLQGRNFDDEKEALMAQFTQGERVIDSSFTTKRGDEVLSPKQGERVEDGEKAKLTIPTTFTITAIPQTELDAFLTTILEETISEDNQFIYNNGAEQVEIGAYEEGDDGATVTVVTTGRVGPKIDESTIKEQVKGKRYGEVQDNLQSLSGVQAVDIRFSYFWVRTVPNNTDKITIEFQVQDE